MEETQDQLKDFHAPNYKLYKDTTILGATFIGGPLVAGYMMAENFKLLQQDSKATITWIISIGFTLFLFGGVLLIPEDVNIPNQLIPLIYILVIYQLVKITQGSQIKRHLNEGGEFYKGWRVFGVAIIGLLISVFIVLLFAVFSDLV